MNKFLLASLVLVVALGVVVSRMKYEVVFLRKQSQLLQTEIEKCIDDIVVYSAEWGFLNDPNRLKKLCQKHLKGMHQMENFQIINHEDLINDHYEEIYIDKSVSNKKNSFRSFVDNVLES
jgi:hypothetical protein